MQARTFVLLVVVLLHLMAFHVFQHLQLAPWLRSAPAHRESSVRTITIALLPNEPVRAIPDRKDRVKPQDRNSRNAPVAESLRQVTEPLPASEVVGTRLMWEPASAPAKPASALRLDAQVIREAVSNAGRGGVRDVARKAGRSQELDAEPVDRLATTMSSAANADTRTRGEALMQLFKSAGCRPDGAKTGSAGPVDLGQFYIYNPKACAK